ACGSGRLGSRDWLSDARCVLLGAAFHGARRAGWYLHRSVVAREGSGSDALSDHPPVCAVSWVSQASDPGEGIERVGAVVLLPTGLRRMRTPPASGGHRRTRRRRDHPRDVPERINGGSSDPPLHIDQKTATGRGGSSDPP